MKTEEQEQIQKILTDLQRRVKYLEDWIATHRCPSLPPTVKRVIGKSLDTEWIPEVEE